MTTSTHLMYLTKYVKETGALLFTVDYPKAPQAKYSKILEVILKFYLFIHFYLKNVVKVTPQIVFVGDSAGGNLVVALC